MAFVFPSATMCCAYAGKAFNCLLLFTNEAAVATSFEAEARHLLLLIALFCCWANWVIYCVRLFWNNFMLICLLIVRLLHPSTPNTKDHPPHPYECVCSSAILPVTQRRSSNEVWSVGSILRLPLHRLLLFCLLCCRFCRYCCALIANEQGH